MGKLLAEIDARLEAFLAQQKVFFVATAPLSAAGHANLSPKGLDSLRVLGPREVAWLDQVGSGAETIAHLRENGRIVLMFCAFEGPPKIVRLHGRGAVVEPQDAEFAALRGRFPPQPHARSIIRVAVGRISESCGFGVPQMRFDADRTQLADSAARNGPDGLRAYQMLHNRESIDGLPALRAAQSDDAAS